MCVSRLNLPEHPLNSALYDPAADAADLDIVRTALPGVPLLDLATCRGEVFFDAGHLDLPNALRVTDPPSRSSPLIAKAPFHETVQVVESRPSPRPAPLARTNGNDPDASEQQVAILPP